MKKGTKRSKQAIALRKYWAARRAAKANGEVSHTFDLEIKLGPVTISGPLQATAKVLAALMAGSEAEG